MNSFSESINQRQLPLGVQNPKINDPSLYKPSDALWNAVSVALEMGLPLLLTGEPGTGKTQLAHYLAWYFNLEKPLVFDAQTTSTARDLFYHYDALGHFQYAQTHKEVLSPDEVEKKFITYQALGKAICDKKRFVVLLDEIDKAPRDLPNNVLAKLEDLSFKVPEVGKEYNSSKENRPVIILTSNSEKNLPDPFLRRVAYFHIPFPDQNKLLEILQAKVVDLENADLDALIQHFEMIRSGKKVKLRKNPATAELLHWALLLVKMGFDTKRLTESEKLTADEKRNLGISYSVLAKTNEDLAALKGLAK